ncbi:MAG: hypothetical protein V4507_02895 [Verrucomicrobiota bacterium]
MGQFDTSLLKAKDLIKFENDRAKKNYTTAERDQWELKAIAVIENTGGDWTKFQSDPPKDPTALKIQFLTVEALAVLIRDRIKSIQKQGPLAFWVEIQDQIQTFSHDKNLFPLGICLKILGSAVQSIEESLSLTEWIIQTPRRWIFKWDAKENLETKIDYLTNEVKNYKGRLDETIRTLSTGSSKIGEEPFIWPHDLESIITLLKIGGVFKPKSLCADLPDVRLTATLLTDPQSCVNVLKQQVASAEKSLDELHQKNESLRQLIRQAKAQAEAGNHLQATETLKLVPPTFRLSEQREVMDYISKINLRLTQVEAVQQKLSEMDLQRLEWGAIQEFCDEIRETIHNEGESASDYEAAASKMLRSIEGFLKAHRRSTIQKWSLIIGGIILFIGALCLIKPKSFSDIENIIEVQTSDSSSRWELYDSDGKLVREGKGASNVVAPHELCYVVIRQGSRAGIERVLFENNFYHAVSQNKVFAYPMARIQILDSTGKNPLDRENIQLQVDRAPVPTDIEGLYISKGVHRFSVSQKGQPDFDTSFMIAQRNEEVTLISPWVPVDFDSNAEDIFISINNSSKRLIPYRFFLPVGDHEAIFTDSRGDIRESRRVHVEGGSANSQEIGAPAGSLHVELKPPLANMKLVINGITHNLKKGERTLTLTTGPQQIQVFQNNQLIYEASLVLRMNEEAEKIITLH